MADQKKQPDILEILRQAEEKNRSDMKLERDAPKPELQKTLVADEQSKKKQTKVTKRINAETAELIDMYSTRPVADKLTDTQKLRMKLAEQNEGSELLEYVADSSEKKPSQRVEKLYKMINDAKTRTLSEGEKLPPAAFAEYRFVDEAEVPKFEEYTQEEMFPLGDTLRVGAEEKEQETASFDSGYEELTEKVTGRDLHFEEEETEGQVKFVTDDDKLTLLGEEALDETDINLRLAFEMMEDEDGRLDQLAKQTESSKKRSREPEETKLRYTDRKQNGVISALLTKRVRTSMLKLIIVSVLTAAILFLELATKDSSIHSDFTKQGRYGILYILIDLQLLFFIALTMLDSIRNGIKGITTFRLSTDSLLAISVFFAAAYSVVIMFTDPSAIDLRLYNLPAAFCCLCSALINLLDAKKNLRCFRVVAVKKPKYTACQLGSDAKEADEFYKYLFEDSELYTVKRADFVDGFMERIEKRPKSEDIFNFLVPAIFLAGVALFVTLAVMGYAPVDSYAAFSILIAASMPATAFFANNLPLISANRVGKRFSTAFVGNAVSEEYAQASVLSFADTEVYPANLVKITNIRMYGDFRIDAILTDLAKLFGHVGGPLSKVLAATITEKFDSPALIRTIECANDGLCIAMDGRNYFLGKKSYMRRYRFDCPVDDGDDAYERTNGSIMYVVVNDKPAAKLYIKYTVNPLFEALLREMYKANLCVGIKTLDPNINNDLINRAVSFKKCPVSVLRSNSPQEVAGEVQRLDSGIVCSSSLHSFLTMFALCDKAKHVTKSNFIISSVSVFLSFAAVAFLAITGDVGAITSLHAVAFQLFWLLPVWLVSFFMM